MPPHSTSHSVSGTYRPSICGITISLVSCSTPNPLTSVFRNGLRSFHCGDLATKCFSGRAAPTSSNRGTATQWIANRLLRPEDRGARDPSRTVLIHSRAVLSRCHSSLRRLQLLCPQLRCSSSFEYDTHGERKMIIDDFMAPASKHTSIAMLMFPSL